MISRLRRKFKNNMTQWVEKRLPQLPSVTLNQSRIFIVPTRQGLVLLIVALLVLLLAINFESALNYALAFWLIAMLWVAVHLTYRNLSGLTLSAQAGTLVQAGDKAEVTLQLQSVRATQRGVLEFIHEEWGSVHAEMSAKRTEVVLPIEAVNRGPVVPPRFRIESRYPFGLIVAWSHVSIDARAWAYPAPIRQDRVSFAAEGDEDEQSLDDHFYKEGSEDFHSLRAYQPGDPIKRLHWPGFSRDQLLVKSFSDYQSSDEFIDWEQFPGLSAESRLAAIAFFCQEFYDRGQPFGVSMPGTVIEPGKGVEHLTRVRRLLAEYGYV